MAKAKSKTKRSAKASTKIAFSPKNIGKNAKTTLFPTLLGFIAGNVVTKAVPTKNDPTSKGIPALAVKGGVTALGVVGMATNHGFISGLGAGMAMHGGIGVLNDLKDRATGSISGIADNPMVQKALDLLIPNLGNIEQISSDLDMDLDLTPRTFDVAYQEVDNDDPYASALNGFANDPYSQEY